MRVFFFKMCANVMLDKGDFRNRSKEVFTTNGLIDGITVREANVQESRFACLGNLFLCRGETGKVSKPH